MKDAISHQQSATVAKSSIPLQTGQKKQKNKLLVDLQCAVILSIITYAQCVVIVYAVCNCLYFLEYLTYDIIGRDLDNKSEEFID